AYRAQGTPVVATDIGDCRSLVGNDGGTIVEDADNDDALAEAVRGWLGRRAPHVVRSWGDVRDQILRLW
ncbi:MAG: hypothetical protein AAFV53_32025, partial [Myxococcota bacterium]